jgi:[protein-PII] uridylyltransferase
MRYTIIRRENERSIGTFARATGALSSSGLTILRAQIEMVGEYAWDNFWVSDPEFPQGETPAERTGDVCKRVCYLMDTPDEPLPPRRQTWATPDNREPESVNMLPKKVIFDNETVDRYTILSFFAYDEVELLYRIATTLAEKQVVLHFAKIDTHLDQVADVFYVSEQDGSKLTDPDRRREIREALLDTVGS